MYAWEFRSVIVYFLSGGFGAMVERLVHWTCVLINVSPLTVIFLGGCHSILYHDAFLSSVSLISINLLMYRAFAVELSDLSKPFKFARLKGFERLENCLTKGTYERF